MARGRLVKEEFPIQLAAMPDESVAEMQDEAAIATEIERLAKNYFQWRSAVSQPIRCGQLLSDDCVQVQLSLIS